jgi:pimeloyl-ACP methyl ester carboxylesterase
LSWPGAGATAVEVEPGVRLHVVDTEPQPGAAGSRPAARARTPVVLLAGLGLDHECWTGTAAALAVGGHRVVGIDLRGTGRSDAPTGGYSIDRLALDVLAVLDRLDLSGAVLIGHSFGAQVALLIAATAPGRLSRVALVSSNGVRAARSADFPFGADPDRLEPALVRAELTDRLTARHQNVRAGFPPSADPDPALVERLVAWQLRMPTSAALSCLHTYLHADLTAALAAVKVPVLQILGRHDPVTAVDGGPWVQDRLADGRLVVLDCGHYPMFELPERFEALLAAFAGDDRAGGGRDDD